MAGISILIEGHLTDNTFKHKKSNVSQYSEVGITLRTFKLYSGVADPYIDFYIMSKL